MIEFLGTALLLLSTGLTSFDIQPANKIVLLLGIVVWTYIGFQWKKKSLIICNIASIITMAVGYLINHPL